MSKSTLKKDKVFSKDIEYLADITRGYRNKDSALLKNYQKINIKKINRLIIEERYSNLSPKKNRYDNPPKIEDLKKVAVQIYHVSKNHVYRNENYFKELSVIQERIFFARSFCLSIVITLSILVLTICFRLIFKASTSLTSPYYAVRWNKYIVCNIIFICLFLGLFCVGSNAYEAEEKAYARRIFGFYLSLPVEKPKQFQCCLVNKDNQQTLNQETESNKFHLQQQYIDAIQDAKVAEPGEVYRYLVAINPKEKGRLKWDNEKKRVLVVTWTDWNGYDDNVKLTMTNDRKTWVTTVPELKDFCQRTEIIKSEVELRLEQLLGLPPNSDKTRFVEMWVRPDDLFRPSPDPEISDHVADLDFSESNKIKKQSKGHLKWFDDYHLWFDDLKEKAYKYNGYPWTRLGYTFDWGGDPNSDVGLSEFVIKKGAEIEVKSITKTQDYCK